MESSDFAMASTPKLALEEPYCRCCLASSADAEDLFDMKIVAFDYQENQTITYFNAYLETSGCCSERLAEISCDSYMICQKCANQLELAYAFRAQCTFVMNELEQQYAMKQLLYEQPIVAIEDDFDPDQLLDIQIKVEEPEEDILVLSDDDQEEKQLLIPINDTPKRTKPIIDYRCNQCPKKFRFEHNFRQHYEEAHQNPETSYKCEPCNLVYRRKFSLLKHNETKHLMTGYPCKECGMIFKAESTLSFHKQVNHKRIRFQCPDCHKQFTHGPNLWSHSFVHRRRSEVPFKCSECGFGTANHTYFKVHLKTNHGIKYDETVYGYLQATRKAISAMTKKCKITI
jgi:hypothetical protein